MKKMSNTRHKRFYEALLNKDSAFDGVFYVGVKTTGVFCRPVCPARKPKYENCEFFETAQEALAATFRPCLRCKPLSNPGSASELVRVLVEAVESNPEHRWKDRDLKKLFMDSSTARRQFRKKFGMTFVQYARARRLGLAMSAIRSGDSVIEAQLSAGYESGSGFRDAFSKIMGGPPSHTHRHLNVLKASWIDTPLGTMLAIADENHLHLLEFVDPRGLEQKIERLSQRTQSTIIPGETKPIKSIEKELAAYFDGTLQVFKTPLYLLGSDFQKMAWRALLKIPYGETRSYADQACTIGKETAFRAVAGANAANQLAIVIPCHRIINKNGKIGGYAGGIARKKWLLEHERKNKRGV